MLKQEEMVEVRVAEKNIVASVDKTVEQGVNMVCKGSKVTGNMIVSQDLQMSGDLEGDITAENNASIFIKGTYKGNINAKGGNVEVEGEMSGGNIVAGGHVKVTGKFLGGKIQAKDKIHVNGEFIGSLESDEVELGAAAKGRGEILYKDALSIQKGAKVEGQITRVGGEASRMPAPERKPEQIPVQKTEQKLEQKAEPAPKKGFFSSEPKPRKGFFKDS
jgi:cytoskeletal protein CcmA (bactofilin family)